MPTYMNDNQEYTPIRASYGHIFIEKTGIWNVNTCVYPFAIDNLLHN